MAMDFVPCGERLLEFYEAAFASNAAEFQGFILDSLNRVVGFERAWWGIMSPSATGFSLLSSYRADLPESFESKWRTVTHDDQLAARANAHPMRTVRFDTPALHATRGLYELNEEHDIRHALCTSVRLGSTSDAFLFISLFRCGRSVGFTKTDVTAKQFLMPHIHAGWRHNLRQQFRTCSESLGGVTMEAFIDMQGDVVESHPNFGTLLRNQWPQWIGPALPSNLLSSMKSAASQPVTIGKLIISVKPSGGLSLLSIRRRPQTDVLTPRESEIALAFARGSSYKEISRELALAPATVRHHLRAVYLKLEVSSKAQLGRVIGDRSF